MGTKNDDINSDEKKRWTLSKKEIDMNTAFDTVKRSIIIELLYDAGCASDDVRPVHHHMQHLKIRVNKSLSEELESLQGAFQEGCLTLVLAAALNHLTAVSRRPNPQLHHLECHLSGNIQILVIL